MKSIAKTEAEKELIALCEGILVPAGFRVVDVDLHVSGRSIVRIYVERSSGQNVSIDDCVEATRLLDPVLESSPLIPGAFELEVSSPGLDKRLRLKSDFEHVLGDEIKLKLSASMPGVGVEPRGRLLRVEEETVVLEVSKASVSVPFSSIRKAHKVWHPEKSAHR